MGKKMKMKMKMKISSLFNTGLLSLPLCYNANTLSFRLNTVDSVFFHPNGDVLEADTPDSWFTNSSDSDHDLDAETLEMVIRGVVRSERLFFDPGVTSSILKESDVRRSSEDRDCPPLEDISVAVAMESEDPYGDFRRSMEEMVRSHEELAKDWESLEAMLGWYLRMNAKRSHGVIVTAFVDLIVSLAGGRITPETASLSESTRCSTAVSSVPSSPVYSSRGHNDN